MPKKPPMGKRFKPGQSGNPTGRPKLPDDVLQARALNKIELERLLNKYLYMDRGGLSAAAQDASLTAIELLIASIVHKAIVAGDTVRLDFLLNRLIGKTPDQTKAEIEYKFEIVKQVEGYTDEEIKAKLPLAIKMLQGKNGSD